jgi:hypothetical protein
MTSATVTGASMISLRGIGECGYVVLVAACAALGAVTKEPGFYLAAIALALPVGIAALLGIYGGYALLDGIGGLVADTQRPDGRTATWLLTSSAVLNILLITAAAVVNVLALEWWLRRRAVSAHISGQK